MLVDGAFSGYDKVLSGVPQGTVLGPLLLLCHIRAWLKRSSDDDIFSSNSKWSNEGHAYIFLMFMISDNFPEHIRAEFLSIF